MSVDRPVSACPHEIDERLYAVCAVCADRRMCLDCGRSHLCTSECASRGCIAGLCVKLVRDGIVASTYGIP